MKTRIVLLVLPFLILALALASGFILLWRLFFLNALLLLFSYLWTRLGIRGITAHVGKPAERCQVGHWLDEEITLFNRSRLPKPFIRVQENSNLPGHHNMTILNLAPRSSQSWQTRVVCQRRGRYRLGEITITVSDPFGLFSRHRHLGEPQNVLIYPATPELPFFQPLFRSEPGYGPSRWLVSESSTSAARVREYTNSDSYNHIHWHSSAHTGKLMVKVFDPDRSTYASKDIWIILDMEQSAYPGGDGSTMTEDAVTIAASLLKKYIDSDKQVGLITTGDQPYLFPPQAGNQHLWQVMEALALVKAKGEVTLDQLIQREAEHFGTNPVIIVITPSTTEATTSSLRRLRNRGAMVIAILLDPASFGGTESATSTANRLIAGGLQVYVVRQGEELSRALDTRTFSPHLRLSGEAVSSD